MQISDILAQSGGLQSIARDLGISETEAAAGAAALTPAILGGFEKQAQSQASPEGLGGLLSQLGGGGLLDNLLSPQPTDVTQGNNVLGQIFGSKDVSRTVAQHASTQSGLSPQVLKKMLPLLAMLITGYLAKKRAGSPGQASGGSGGLGGLLGGLLGGGAGGLGSMFGSSGSGNPLDDILSRTR